MSCSAGERVTGHEQIVCSSFAGMLADIAWIGQYESVGQYDELRSRRRLRYRALSCRRRGVGSIAAIKEVSWGGMAEIACRLNYNASTKNSKARYCPTERALMTNGGQYKTVAVAALVAVVSRPMAAMVGTQHFLRQNDPHGVPY
jgi:hypothetical protein